MRVSIAVIVALLTSDITAGPAHQADCRCSKPDLSKMTEQHVETCAIVSKPTASLPVRDESQDFTCDMCPPPNVLAKLKKKLENSKDAHELEAQKAPGRQRIFNFDEMLLIEYYYSDD